MTQIKLKTGNYSDIKLISLLKNDVYVEKIYGKKTIIGTKITPVLFDYFLKYKRQARAMDLPMCDTSYERIIHGLKNSYIVEFQSYITTNFEDFIRGVPDPRTLTLYIERYLRIFSKIWGANFPIGVDPSIRNFGIDSDGDLKFFDFFPPHQKISETEFFLWPEPSVADRPFLIKRYFTFEQSRVIYAQLMRHLVGHRLMSPAKLKSIIVAILGDRAIQGITISDELKRRVLSKPCPYDMDLIRMIASELCFEKKITHNQLTMIFKNTHINSHNILTSQPSLLMMTKILNKAISK